MEKLIVYIDGFNLYYGLRDLARHKLLWLDLVELSRSLRPRSKLVQVMYFTAPVLDDPPAASRQSTYQRALLARWPGEITIVQGRYQWDMVECNRCGHSWRKYEEKETDVNIATTLVADAALGNCTSAIIVSGDSDLVPAIRSVRRIAPKLFMAAAFPPKRHSAELKKLMPRSFHIGRAKINQSLLPDVVTATDGSEHKRPQKWY